MIQLAEVLPPTPTPLWTLCRQMGVDYVVGQLPFDDPLNGSDAPWELFSNGAFVGRPEPGMR